MQQYQKITQKDLDFFIETCGNNYVFSDKNSLTDYSKDYT